MTHSIVRSENDIGGYVTLPERRPTSYLAMSYLVTRIDQHFKENPLQRNTFAIQPFNVEAIAFEELKAKIPLQRGTLAGRTVQSLNVEALIAFKKQVKTELSIMCIQQARGWEQTDAYRRYRCKYVVMGVIAVATGLALLGLGLFAVIRDELGMKIMGGGGLILGAGCGWIYRKFINTANVSHYLQLQQEKPLQDLEKLVKLAKKQPAETSKSLQQWFDWKETQKPTTELC